jgi:CHRD domain
MRAIGTGFVAVAAIGLLLGGCGGGDDNLKGTTTTTTRQPTVFNVNMTGTEEVPGPGDLAGTGSAQITVDPNGTQICFILTESGIDGVTAAHIHEGKAGVSGPVVVTLTPPTTGSVEDCVDADATVIKNLSAGTRSYYVNLHSTAFPNGAVRAQLTG